MNFYLQSSACSQMKPIQIDFSLFYAWNFAFSIETWRRKLQEATEITTKQVLQHQMQ